MVRGGRFGHFGAGGHEGLVKEPAVVARVADRVDDAHDSLRVCLPRSGWFSIWMWVCGFLGSMTTFGG